MSIKLGRPDPERDNHTTYTGVWCQYPEVRCSACLGTGWRKIRYPDRPKFAQIADEPVGEPPT